LLLAPALASSHLHLPDEVLPPGEGGGRIAVEVTNETTLAAARRIVHELGASEAVAALDFASATKPGGGYRNGAEAQEGSLARASALGTCLERVPAFYEHHQRHRHPLYTDRVICSPGVPVFRDDSGRLLGEPYPVTFLTAAAPNAGALADRGWTGDLDTAVRQRARRVLAVAAGHGHRQLVLGAWGCGVFRNDPAHVATVFADLLRDGFAGAFTRVTFAVVEGPPGTGTFRTFHDALHDL
jgi:uncharacterized protein (TIGR02452 family)